MEASLKAVWETPARRRAMRIAAGLALGLVAGAILATSPMMFVLAAALVGMGAVLLINFRAGFLLGGALLLLQLPVQNLVQDIPETDLAVRYADEALILLLGVAAVWHALRRIRRLGAIAAPLLALIASLGLGVAAALWHEGSTRAIVLDAFSLSKWGMIFFAAYQVQAGTTGTLRILRITTFIAAGLAVIGWIDMVFPSLTHDFVPVAGPVAYRMGLRCLVSVFPNEGYSGWFFAAAACLPIAGYLVERRRADLWMSVFLLVTSFMSYRRKPILGIAFALGILLLTRMDLRNKRRILVAAAVTALIVLPILGSPLREIFSDAYAQYLAPRDAMQVARNAMYITSWRIGRDYFPLGAGLGLFGGHASTIQYSEFYARYGLDRIWGLAGESENSPNFVMDVFFPHVLGALGLVGATLYILSLLSPGWMLMRAGRRADSPAMRILAIAGLLVFCEALAESVAAPVYEVSFPCYFIFGLAGLVLAVAPEAGQARLGSAPRPPPPSARSA